MKNTNFNGLKGYILAAGHGQRLAPITDDIPKPLIPLFGNPLIHHQLRVFANFGIKEVGVNLHHLGSEISKYIKKYEKTNEWNDLRAHFFLEEKLLGTGGFLKNLAPLFQQSPLLILNGDALWPWDINHLYDFYLHQRSAHDCVAVFSATSTPFPDENAVWVQHPSDDESSKKESRLIGFSSLQSPPSVAKKQGAVIKPHGLACMHIVHPRIHQYLPEEKTFFSLLDVYEKAISCGEHIGVSTSLNQSNFFDIGSPSRLENLLKVLINKPDFFKKNFHSTLPIHEYTYEPRSKNLFHRSLMYKESTDLHGVHQSFIDSNVSLGKNIRLKNCLVLSGVCVEGGTRLENQILWRSSQSSKGFVSTGF